LDLEFQRQELDLGFQRQELDLEFQRPELDLELAQWFQQELVMELLEELVRVLG
jgi:hypothetical protein